MFPINTNNDIRENEGEAAQHGVYYDDTEYDYMQHLRDLNSGSGESYFVEAPVRKAKGKTKLKLEDALRETSLDDRAPSYQDQQDVPDELAGFQPNMDPALREVLEALDDEAYVDDEEDIFAELAGKEQDGHDRLQELDELDDGWETDDTTKPDKDSRVVAECTAPMPDSNDVEMTDGTPDHGDGAFMKAFTDQKAPPNPAATTKRPAPPTTTTAAAAAAAASPTPAAPSSILTASSFLMGGKRKKRKGAMMAPSSNYSMTSASLARTEGQTILDARFEKILESYTAEDDDIRDDDGTASMMSGATGTSRLSRVSGLSRASNMSSRSRAPDLVPEPQMRSDFNDIMDDFLDNYSMAGRKRVKKGGYQTGMEQLDEIRKGLGPARVR